MTELRYLQQREADILRKLQAVSRGEGPVGRAARSATEYARAHPVVATGVAVAAGAVLARVLVRSASGPVGELLSRVAVQAARPALRILASSITGR